ncbi:MAG: hypothetical protein EXS38_08150 [Opitutus sp.]|nr:hypothetical protein [Opitutus sp.]
MKFFVEAIGVAAAHVQGARFSLDFTAAQQLAVEKYRARISGASQRNVIASGQRRRASGDAAS